MPSYTEQWDEAKPAGSRNLSLGDDDIREFKRAIRERLAQDHSFAADETGDSTIGYHNRATFYERSSNEAAVTSAVVVFAKEDTDGNVELFATDENGNVFQITRGGEVAGLGTSPWRSGDMIISSNTTAPNGWSDVSATYEDSFIRISSGTPLTTGGADTHDHGSSTDAHTLTTNEIPLHGHPTQVSTNVSGGQDATGGMMLNTGGSASYAAHTGSVSDTAGQQVGGTGGGGSHSHGIASANNIPVFVQLRLYKKT